MGRSIGGILGKESVEGTRWRVGDIEEDGRMKIGTLAAHNDDDDDGRALLGFKGRLEGATNVPRTMVPRPLPRPPPPTLANINIGVPCTMDLPQPSHTGESPIIWVGDYVPAMYGDPNVLVVVGCYPIPIPTPSAPFLSLQPSNHHQGITTPFSTSGNPVVMSVSPSDLSIAVKAAPRPPRLFSPSHRRWDRHEDLHTVHLDIQNAFPRRLRKCCSLQRHVYIYLFLK